VRIKKYVARTLPEAMVQVKTDLGPDAVIMHTSEVKVGGLFGLFGQRMIQVMAAVEEEALAYAGTRSSALPASWTPAAPGPVSVTPPSTVASRVERYQEATQAAVSQPQPAPPPRAESQAAAALATEVAGMKSMITELMERVALPPDARRLEPGLQSLVAAMLNGGVQEQEALAFAQRVRTRSQKERGADLPSLARELMEKELGKVRPVEVGRRVVALVGPTGVGKTTTLAKLAAHFTLQRGMQTALITADTYRVAAVDQLRTYADIIGVPLEVCYEAPEVQAALGRQRHRDIVLVDTAGRSPRNEAHMSELKEYLEKLGADETYLVMSLTSGYRDAVAIVESYLPLGFDRFLFTKWDEAAGSGLIYNLVRKYKRPLSYITTGQGVPEDIETADPAKITRAILGD
jgi:flagellar biosynthesis protein FlhF